MPRAKEIFPYDDLDTHAIGSAARKWTLFIYDYKNVTKKYIKIID